MKYIFSLFLLIMTSQCSTLPEKTLYKQKEATDPITYIKYMGNKKHSYYINAALHSDDSNFNYNIRFLENGKITHVLKYESKYYEMDTTTIDSERSTQFLISDTLGEWGPTYFGESTSGYYDTFVVNNILIKPNLLKRVNKISDAEKRLFRIIDSLAKAKRINLNNVVRSGVLGWFRYEF